MNGDTLSGLDLGATIRGFAPGQVVFERYKLERILGRGGMGVVWLAHDQELNEDVALKFLPEAVRLDALALEELKRETRKSRKLTHRHIVRVYNFVSDATCAGITMEWIDGSPLSALRLERPHRVFEPEELKPWVRQVCEALEYAHNVAKLIHRDLKPANIMLSSAGEAKITDFGISSSLTESASRVSVQATASGTLAYMSPQQALGERPRVSDDVYSLGATLFELISGKPPFFRGDLYAQVRDVVPPPMAERRAEAEIPADGIPEQWEKTIASCLEKDAAKRPQSAMEVAWLLGLVKEFERKAPVVIPKPETIRVPGKEEPKTVPAERGTEVLKTTAVDQPIPQPAPASGPLAGRGVQVAAAAAALVLIAILAWVFTRPHSAPVAVQGSSPAPSIAAHPAASPIAAAAPKLAPAAAATPKLAPVAAATPQPAPAATATPGIAPVLAATSRLAPLPAATPVLTQAPAAAMSPGIAAIHVAAQMSSPVPLISAAPLPTPAGMPATPALAQVQPPAPSQAPPSNQSSGGSGLAYMVMLQNAPAPSTSAPSASGTDAVAATLPSVSGGSMTLDKRLVGRWQAGATRATRKRLELEADGQYLLSVAGTIADTGTMSGSDGQLQQFSKGNPQPAALSYQLVDGDLTTQGAAPFDDTTWHRVTVTHHSSSPDSEPHTTFGQKIKNGMSKFKHLF